MCAGVQERGTAVLIVCRFAVQCAQSQEYLKASLYIGLLVLHKFVDVCTWFEEHMVAASGLQVVIINW